MSEATAAPRKVSLDGWGGPLIAGALALLALVVLQVLALAPTFGVESSGFSRGEASILAGHAMIVNPLMIYLAFSSPGVALAHFGLRWLSLAPTVGAVLLSPSLLPAGEATGPVRTIATVVFVVLAAAPAVAMWPSRRQRPVKPAYAAAAVAVGFGCALLGWAAASQFFPFDPARPLSASLFFLVGLTSALLSLVVRPRIAFVVAVLLSALLLLALPWGPVSISMLEPQNLGWSVGRGLAGMLALVATGALSVALVAVLNRRERGAGSPDHVGPVA